MSLFKFVFDKVYNLFGLGYFNVQFSMICLINKLSIIKFGLFIKKVEFEYDYVYFKNLLVK